MNDKDSFKKGQTVVLATNVGQRCYYILSTVKGEMGGYVLVGNRLFSPETGIESKPDRIPDRIYAVNEETMNWVEESQATLMRQTLLKILEDNVRFKKLSLAELTAVCKILDGELPIFLNWRNIDAAIGVVAMNPDFSFTGYSGDAEADEEKRKWLPDKGGYKKEAAANWFWSPLDWQDTKRERS